MKYLLLVILAGLAIPCLSQPAQFPQPAQAPQPAQFPQPPQAPQPVDLLHTRLEASFNYDSSILYGNCRLTIKPHFYPVDSLTLDAKSLDIKSVNLFPNTPLTYNQTAQTLTVHLPRKTKTAFTIEVLYAAKHPPQGLAFIRAQNSTQIWTDSELGLTSYWCPTVDQPYQKGTAEVFLTVPDRYISVSNGILADTHPSSNHTHIDHWKADFPLPPYCIFFAIGKFTVIPGKSLKNLPIRYLLDSAYAPYANNIFGLTPQMITTFSRLTRTPFPWPKYDQVVLHRFTSTAMENTSVTAHDDRALQDNRELAERNRWEDNIAHELFHQWFGDYVTCKDWNNLALNESFATYGQYLWKEAHYGPDAAAAELREQLDAYLSRPGDTASTLIRYSYNNADELLDNVSYQKGSCILQMLRDYIGDSAFFEGLHRYLNTYKFRSADAQQLRLVFEDITGSDLNWFFNQWFFGAGHPRVDITYSYNPNSKSQQIIIRQLQHSHPFTIPLDIDLYNTSTPTSFHVLLERNTDTFLLPSPTLPLAVNVDTRKTTLWEKTDHKPLSHYTYIYTHNGNYVDRLEAIRHAKDSIPFLRQAAHDPHPALRELALTLLDTLAPADYLRTLAIADSSAAVRAKAIALLDRSPTPANKQLFQKAVHDSAYTVAGAALLALSHIDSTAAFTEALAQTGRPQKRNLAAAVLTVLMQSGTEAQFDLICRSYNALPANGYKLSVTHPFIDYVKKIPGKDRRAHAIQLITAFSSSMPQSFRTPIDQHLKQLSD